MSTLSLPLSPPVFPPFPLTLSFPLTLCLHVCMPSLQEAFDRTGRILNIIVAPVNGNDPPRLLNYLTSPHVLVGPKCFIHWVIIDVALKLFIHLPSS